MSEPAVTRYKMTVEYRGTDFAGWQRQKHVPSVQEEIEKAIFKFSGQEITIQAAGRTDAGVHARGQVFHFDLAPTKILWARMRFARRSTHICARIRSPSRMERKLALIFMPVLARRISCIDTALSIAEVCSRWIRG